MRTVTFLMVILSLVLAVSCGDKDKKKNPNNLPTYNQFQQGQVMTPRTANGSFNLQSGLVVVEGRSFQPNQIAQQSQQFLQQFYYAMSGQGGQMGQYPQQQQIGMISPGVYRVRITGYLIQTGNPQYPVVLTITAPLQAY
jgi:hypothetical protein